RLAMVPDVVEDIATEVRRCAAAFDFVFTSGGVGPTHDDVTAEGVARAFGVALEQRPELVDILRRYNVPENEATLRMATAPLGAKLVDHAGLRYPVLCMRNVWMFPGIPRLLREKFENVAERFAGETVQVARVYTTEHEMSIAARLTELAACHPEVDFGSYPRFGEGAYRVIITLESRDADALQRAHQELSQAVEVATLEGGDSE
ncbi:MAG: competence/damage-inducible protein A, partial [Deltaproteobacteria bacterium]|nr:competence/damage-inducible protein A [Deltaproteobacteria bacterium]